MTLSIPDDLEYRLDRTFLEQALAKWGEALQLRVVKSLVGGRTAASVLLVEIRSAPGTPVATAGSALSGQFVLKLDEKKVWRTAEPTERDRHAAAVAWAPNFAKQHIPVLVRDFEDAERIALLYEIAGYGSRVNLVTIDGLDASSLDRRCGELASAMLRDFNAGYRVDTEIAPAESLQSWLGYRLDPAQAPALHEFVRSNTQGGKIVFTIGRRLLVNPLWLCDCDSLKTAEITTQFSGLLHGDLHPGNFLFDRRYPQSELFWVIDFALSREGPLFYDHSYLELALLLTELVGKEPERLLSILDALSAVAGSSESQRVPPEHLALVNAIRRMRDETERWRKDFEPNSSDLVSAQQLLAAVAASLNWCNKPIDESQRRLSLAYGGWAADRYLSDFHRLEWQRLMKETEAPVAENSGSATAPDTTAWNDFWQAATGFDEALSRFILVTDRPPDTSDLASLGFLPWSAVIDLDPNSDVSGVYYAAAPILGKLRSVTAFGAVAQAVNFERGTAWMMAGGWPTRAESAPVSLNEWRRNYLDTVRQLSTSLHRSIAPQAVKVVVFLHEQKSIEIAQRLLEAMDEKLLDDATFLVVSSLQLGEISVSKQQRFVAAPQDFVKHISGIYGRSEDAKEPSIPGIGGPVSIQLDRLRNLEEDITLLHTNLLHDAAQQSSIQDDFWRGNPPTWADLHADVDIRRPLHERLVKELGMRLSESRSSVLELHHSPGAGGTTAALRAAWNMRNLAPTVILHRFSKLSSDRIDEVFHLAQQPVLLVADASDLPPAARDSLFRDLAKRNSRVVMLYVVRTTHAGAADPFTIADPMSKPEAKLFYRAYAGRTTEAERLSTLNSITNGKGFWEAYRTPFFYGLTTYERDFVSLDRYVQSHLEELAPIPRDVMLYLGLVTRYSQTGISEALIKKFLNLRPESELDVTASMGHGAARLVVVRNRELRLAHPLVAEETLRQLMGGGTEDTWSRGLKDLAIKFIREVVAVGGADSEEVQALLFQLFILRDEWSDEGAQRRHFAALIEAIQSDAGQYEVLQLLTDLCPTEPHFWNHLGRHHIYKARQNYAEAEKFLERAVELSSGRDALHYHALGMVRRFWITDEINKLLQAAGDSPQKVSADDIFERIHLLAEGAFDSFAKARSINKEDAYGYITHVQTFLRIAESLRRAADKQTIQDLLVSSGRVGEWLRKHLFIAEELIERVRHLRGQRKQSDLEVECLTGLSSLYGRFDDLIKNWEGLLDTSREGGYVRRTLATVYLAKRNRTWSQVRQNELRRITELMESNLSYDPTNAHDLRMWFQAYHRLPEFNYFSALDRLESWASREDSLDAHYYLYVLHFLRWREGGERDEDLIIKHLEKCVSLRIGQRGLSYEWLGDQPKWCPLVHVSELGAWDPQAHFFRDPSKLVFVEGTIATLKPQAGTVRLGKQVRAFFVPPAHIRESKDLNATVHFYLGFSYDGLRAWSVDLGPAPKEGRTPGHVDTFGVSTRMYVGNLSYKTLQADLIALIDPHAAVEDVQIASDRVTGRSLGFAFFKVPSVSDAEKVSAALDGTILHGRQLSVRIANPRGFTGTKGKPPTRGNSAYRARTFRRRR